MATVLCSEKKASRAPYITIGVRRHLRPYHAARRQTCRAIDLVYQPHVQDSVRARRRHWLFTPHRRDERAQLAGIGSIALDGFLPDCVADFERELMTVVGRDRINDRQFA